MPDLIVYFSRRHQNYVNGVIRDLKVGNTEVAAQMIHRLTRAELFQIEPLQEYSKNVSPRRRRISGGMPARNWESIRRA